MMGCGDCRFFGCVEQFEGIGYCFQHRRSDGLRFLVHREYSSGCDQFVERIGKCPHCGDYGRLFLNCQITCSSCEMKGPQCETREEAVSLWNKLRIIND
jgi:hypothetical protein